MGRNNIHIDFRNLN